MKDSEIDLAEVAKRIAEHHEKTGTVLVGMHTELQEQKARLRGHEQQVASMVVELGNRVREVLDNASTSLDNASSSLDEVAVRLAGNKAAIAEANEAYSRLTSASEDLKLEIERQQTLLQNGQDQFLTDARSALSGAIAPTVDGVRSELERLHRFVNASVGELNRSHERFVEATTEAVKTMGSDTIHFDLSLDSDPFGTDHDYTCEPTTRTLRRP